MIRKQSPLFRLGSFVNVVAFTTKGITTVNAFPVLNPPRKEIEVKKYAG